MTCNAHLPCDTRPSVMAGMVTNPAHACQWRRTVVALTSPLTEAAACSAVAPYFVVLVQLQQPCTLASDGSRTAAHATGLCSTFP